VPGETRSPRQTSGVRFATPAVTSRGATEDQMRRVAELIVSVADAPDNAAHLEELRAKVRAIAESL